MPICARIASMRRSGSTLLRCINHLETIDDGTIHFEGKPVYRYKENGKIVVDPDRRIEAIRAQIGMVFQAFNLFPHLTALGNVIEAPVHVLREPAAEAQARGTGAAGEGRVWPRRPDPIRISSVAGSSSGWRSPARLR